jgi:hypothetical protein
LTLNNFEINKIKGDFAELICKHHFELMGYNLNKIGIEEISPIFAKIRDKNSFITPLKTHLQNMPDFLAVCEDRKICSFIEVKFRENIDDSDKLVKLSKELHEQYKIYIDDKLPLYFYVVTNMKPYIYVLKADSLKYKEDTGGFYEVGNKSFDNFQFFKAISDKKSFNYIYSEVIEKFIVQIIKVN